MINPGIETNPVFPTSSSQGNNGSMAKWYGKQIFTIDGFTLTMGCLVALIVLWLVWQTWFAKGRRR
jgi:hypothetical protein